jgi:hypothetical protein
VPSLRAACLDSRPVWVWDIPSSCRLSAARCDLRRQSMTSEPPLLVSSSEKQVRVGRHPGVWSDTRTAHANRHVCMHAPLILRFGLTHGKPCPQVTGVVRRAARRSEMKVMFAVRVRLVRSSLGPASTCIEDLRERTGSAASCSARPQQSYRVRHRRLESWTSSQERRGLCQAPDTTSASRAQKVEDGTSSLFARKHTARKLEGPERVYLSGLLLGTVRRVYWWLLGHELSVQAKSLGSRPRSSNRCPH